MQRFLLHTCILERLCAQLCAAVLDGAASPAASIAACQEALEALERHNVFVVALDDERRWYRFHYLFAEAVRQRQINHASIPDVAVLHRRASVWLQQHNYQHEAVTHALAGGCHETAVDLIRRSAPELLARGEQQTLYSWLLELPEERLRAEPQLCIAYATFLRERRDHDGAERYLQYAEEALIGRESQAQDEVTTYLLSLNHPQHPMTQLHDTGSVASIRALIGVARSSGSAGYDGHEGAALQHHGTAARRMAALGSAHDGRQPRGADRAAGSRALSILSPVGPGEPVEAESLTERERDVLRLLAAGQSNPEIARALFIEVNTVKTHLKSLYGKLGAHSRVEAAGIARERGIL
jgi:ATP/maltotriose-dependent transcriptional regulator MalT